MILGIIQKDSGPGFHRILMPLITMPQTDCMVTNQFTDEMLDRKQPDVVYYNRMIDDSVWKQRKERGFKIAVDVDDHWMLNPGHIAYQSVKRTGYSVKCIEHMRNADVVTTTHERLAEEIYRYNKNVHILPNAIPKHDYFPTDKKPSDKVRVFWQGSITHEKDLELLSYSIKGLYHAGEQPQMVIAGLTDHPVWRRMAHAYIYKHDGEVLPGVSIFDYYKHYAHADIAVIPLVENSFNTYKSNLKFLEAANMGLPVICSHVDPYLNLPVLYAHGKKDWQILITDLLHDADLRYELGQVNKEFAEKNYNFDKINEARKLAIS